MDIYNKSTDSKRYVAFTSNHLRSCLRSIPFCLTRRIYTIVEEENAKLKRLSARNIKTTKISYCFNRKWLRKSFTNTIRRTKET